MHRTDGPRNNPVPVQIATPVEISATSNHDGKPISHGVGLGNQIATRFTDIIGMSAFQWRLFGVGKRLRFPIRLV